MAGEETQVAANVPLPKPRPEGAPSPPTMTDEEDPVLKLIRESGLPTGGQAEPKPGVTPPPPDPVLSILQSEGLSAPTPETPPTQQDGFWSLTGRALVRGAVESGTELKAGATALAPGSSVAEQAAVLPKAPQDELQKLLLQPVADGWTDPKWWGANIAHAVGGMAPSLAIGGAGMLAGGGVGTAMGGPPGGAVGALAGGAGGFALGGALQQLVPAFQRAKEAGLSDDDAMNRALTESGVVGAFSAVMGVVPAGSLYGRTITDALKRPILEALTQMGVVLPAIGTIQAGTIKSIESGGSATLSPDEIIKGWITNAGSGAIMVGAHAGGSRLYRAVRDAPASPDTVQRAFGAATGAPEEPFVPASRRPETTDFYEKINAQVAAGPDKAPAHVWVAEMLKVVKPEDLEWLKVPSYLQDRQGNVPREELQKFIESRGAFMYDIAPGEKVTPTILGAAYSPTGLTLALDTVAGQRRIADVFISDRIDRDGKVTLAVEQVRMTNSLPPSYISSFAEFTARLLLRKAALWSYERIMLPTGERVVDVYRQQLGGLDATAEGHLLKFYDKDLPAAFDKLADQLGMAKGDTTALSLRKQPMGTTNRYIDVSPVARGDIRQGYWAFSERPGTRLEEIRSAGEAGRAEEFPEIKITPEQNAELEARLAARYGKTAKELIQEMGGFGKPMTTEEFLKSQGVRELSAANMNSATALFGKPRIPPRDAATPPTGTTPTAAGQLLLPAQLRPAARRITQIVEEFRKAMGMKVPIRIEPLDVIPKSDAWGQAGRDERGYYIKLSLSAQELKGAEGLYSVAAHEFGHVVMYHFFEKSSMGTKNAIVNAFNEWRDAHPPGMTFAQLGMRRDNAVQLHYEKGQKNTDSILSMTPERQRYWNGFEEWFAEQVARWATTTERPLGIVDKFFESLGRRVREVVETFRSRTDPQAALANKGLPTDVMKAWLDSLMKDGAPFAADTIAAAQQRSQRANQAAHIAAGEPYVEAVPQTLSTNGGRGILSKLFGRAGVGESGAIASSADRFNRFYDLMISLPQLAASNLHIAGLQKYKEIVAMMHLEKTNMMSEAEVTLGMWRDLHGPQGDAVARFIDDYMNMRYRTAEEIKNKITRKPTQREFEQLVRRHGLSDKGVEVFRRVTGDFDRMLDRYREVLEQEAAKIDDPVMSAQKYADISERIEKMRKAPYFPAMRFGSYTVTVRDAAGHVVHFETAESPKQQAEMRARLQRQYPSDAGHVVRVGYLEKDVAPLVGMPPGLLDKLAANLDLSPTQKAALEELKFDYTPAQSFAHRFQMKNMTPGYSHEFLRAYAHYFFHGANYFTRAKYVNQLREAVRDTREQSKELPDAVKRDQIVNFMQDHLKNLLDPKADFTTLRAAMFHWMLGFNPAAATLNLSQSILGTYPYLAQHFGDFRTIAAMGKSNTKLSTFYGKKRLVDTTEAELQGMREAMREGVLTEAMAPSLAATADGRSLTHGFGGNLKEKAWHNFSRASSFMFETTEQYNRRLAFRTAWDLASANPNNAHVADMVKTNALQYKSLLDKGWSEQDAASFVTAKAAVENTQYIYAPYARPKFMRGKLGTLFVFKTFTQNTLFYLWNNPSAAARSLLIMAGVGGLMGLPGVEDMNGIIRTIGYRLFGKDWDLQDAVREFVVDHMKGGGGVQRPGDIRTKEGGIRPDILLHGLSRVGYGIPALMDMMGSLAPGQGHVPMPVVDRHANIGMGNILPIEPGVFGAPEITGATAGGQNTARAEIGQVQRASGAAFGLGFALYKAITSSQYDMSDFKRWEGVMPAAIRNASKAFRYYSEGGERNATGATVVRFNSNEPEHMAEIAAQAMGYRPERLAAYWDRTIAEREQEAFWDIRKQLLLRNAWDAKQSGDSDKYATAVEAIRKFNKDLPDEIRPKAISMQTLQKSFETRATAKAKTEADIPRSTQNIPLSRQIKRLYPEADAGRETGPRLPKELR